MQPYAVTARAAIDPDSITICDAQAVLTVADGAAASVAHNVANTGDIELQNASNLNVGGTINIGGAKGSAATVVPVAIVPVEGAADLGAASTLTGERQHLGQCGQSGRAGVRQRTNHDHR